MLKYRTYLLFGSPGAGKGTAGKIWGQIPGFYHFACGDIFRSLDLRSEYGQIFLKYSSEGKLVPDEITIGVWRHHIQNMVTLGRFKTDIDHLILDGIPRNLSQATLLESNLDVKKVFHLVCTQREQLIERIQRRALKENRMDDASVKLIEQRLEIYDHETKPVLEFYRERKVKVIEVDALEYPYRVLRDILNQIDTDVE
jgi:adenylate kinase